MEPNPVTDDSLSALPGLRHGFFTRKGGKSSGLYNSLNVGLASGDDQKTIMENRARIADWFGQPADHLLSAYQIHSADVIIAQTPFFGERPEGDAVVTATPGLIVGASTADCGPVLFADPQTRVIGAAHAGWKGATTGILENTIAAMEELGAKRQQIIAVLGPMISQENYEVGPEFVDNLLDLADSNQRFLAPSSNPGNRNHAMFDLPAYILDRLTMAGVSASWSGQCTYADSENFFSYRRKTHRKEAANGIQISAIMISPES